MHIQQHCAPARDTIRTYQFFLRDARRFNFNDVYYSDLVFWTSLGEN